MRKRTQAREYALQVLYQREMNPETLPKILKDFWADHDDVTEDVRTFTERVVFGVSEHMENIDEVLNKYTENWKLNRLAAVDRNILRLATFELLFMSDIPPKVSINEAVNIAKKFSQLDSGKFVNGVLDKINHTEKPQEPSSN